MNPEAWQATYLHVRAEVCRHEQTWKEVLKVLMEWSRQGLV
jgi:hypothetical protein